MSGFVVGAGCVFLAANIVLFLVLVGKTLRVSKPAWERMEEDEAQASWLQKPDASRIVPVPADEQYAEARWERSDGTTEVRRYKALPDDEQSP